MKAPGPQIWVRVPLALQKSLAAQASGGDDEQLDTWHWWNDFRSTANGERKFGVVLDVGSLTAVDDFTLKRWLGEPVKALVVNTRCATQTLQL